MATRLILQFPLIQGHNHSFNLLVIYLHQGVGLICSNMLKFDSNALECGNYTGSIGKAWGRQPPSTEYCARSEMSRKWSHTHEHYDLDKT